LTAEFIAKKNGIFFSVNSKKVFLPQKIITCKESGAHILVASLGIGFNHCLIDEACLRRFLSLSSMVCYSNSLHVCVNISPKEII